VEAYLRDGASVCINGRSAERGAEIAGQLGHPERVHFMAGDVMERADVDAFVDGTVERFGRIDVLVNNAGAPTSTRRSPSSPTRRWSWR